MKERPLTKRNIIALIVGFGFFIIGVAGGIFDQKWAENIYTFWTIVLLVVAFFAAISKTALVSRKISLILYGLCLAICVVTGWWFLTTGWVIIICCIAYCMTLEKESKKEQVKEEAK